MACTGAPVGQKHGGRPGNDFRPPRPGPADAGSTAPGGPATGICFSTLRCSQKILFRRNAPSRETRNPSGADKIEEARALYCPEQIIPESGYPVRATLGLARCPTQKIRSPAAGRGRRRISTSLGRRSGAILRSTALPSRIRYARVSQHSRFSSLPTAPSRNCFSVVKTALVGISNDPRIQIHAACIKEQAHGRKPDHQQVQSRCHSTRGRCVQWRIERETKASLAGEPPQTEPSWLFKSEAACSH